MVTARARVPAMACVGGPAAGRGGARRRRDLWRSSARCRVAVTSKPHRPVEKFGMPSFEGAKRALVCSQIWDVALAAGRTHTHTQTIQKVAPPAKTYIESRARYFRAGG